MSPRGAGLLAAAALLAAALAGACGDAQPTASSNAAPSASASESAPIVAAERAGACIPNTPSRLLPVHPGAASAAVAVARLDGARDVAVLADEDQRALHVFDAATLEELGVTATKGRPRHVRVLGDGRVAVTERDPERVVIYALDAPTEPLRALCDREVPSDPFGIAEAPGVVLVASGYGASLTSLDAGDLEILRSVALAPEPRSVVVDPGGKTAYVSHAILGRVSVVDLADERAPVGEIPLGAGRLDEPGAKKPRRRGSSQGYPLVPVPEIDGHPFHLLVPGTTIDPGTKSMTVTATYGGGSAGTVPVAPIISTVDVRARRTLTIEAQGSTEGRDGNCLLPRSAVLRDGALYVACLDLGEVVAFDATVVDPSTLVLRRYRVPVGPSALALTTAGELLVWSEIDRRLSRLDPGAKKPLTIDEAKRTDDVVASVTPWARDGGELDPILARGRFLFHTTRDARLSFFRACASCHPEGRADGLSWTSPDGLRQTPMLAGRLDGAAPFGWNGEHASLEVHVRDTVVRLGGGGLFPNDVPADKADLEALLAYVRSLPTPAPLAPRTDSLARGQRVFESVCARCHARGATDGMGHDIGSTSPDEDSHRQFGKGKIDTPSLTRLAGSAPYFHDGRYATLEGVVGATDGKMFDPERMDQPDRDALVAYLKTL